MREVLDSCGSWAPILPPETPSEETPDGDPASLVDFSSPAKVFVGPDADSDSA
jgi:hypothetical protein